MGSRVLAIVVLGLFVLLLGGCEDDAFPNGDPQALESERTGWPVVFSNDLGMRFRIVPAGDFQMGSPEDEAERDEGESLHEVHIRRPYYLQTTEVTNAMWRRFRPDHAAGADDTLPVASVSHEDAVAFAAWLTKRDPRVTYRLPTEAEWELACRAGTKTAFSCGTAVTAEQATLACEPGQPPPGSPSKVASHPANPWGFFDLHGNVAEWCHDRYGALPLWRQDNPQGAAEGTERVVRGGSYADPAARARCAARTRQPADHRCATVGFRLAFGLSYGRCEHGRYPVVVRTVDPTVEEGEDSDRPGWPMYMISVVDRLTDRVNRLPEVRWISLAQPSPITLKLAPGIYYVYSYRMEGEKRVRSIERKFAIPGPDEIRCPIPRKYQKNPQ